MYNYIVPKEWKMFLQKMVNNNTRLKIFLIMVMEHRYFYLKKIPPPPIKNKQIKEKTQRNTKTFYLINVVHVVVF